MHLNGKRQKRRADNLQPAKVIQTRQVTETLLIINLEEIHIQAREMQTRENEMGTVMQNG